MALLQETIVYLWLIPVVTHIIIPLVMLVGWSMKNVLNVFLSKRLAPVAITGSELKPVGSPA